MHLSRLGAIVCLLLFAGTLRSETFTVINTSPSSLTTGSLTWCIKQATDNVGADTIVFAIGSGPKTIFFNNSVGLTGSAGLTIDGGSQPGFSGEPIITLVLPRGYSSFLSIYSHNVTVRDLKLVGATASAAIECFGSNCTFENLHIGVDGADVPSDYGKCGIKFLGAANGIVSHCSIGFQQTGVSASGANNLWVYDSFIGTDSTGTASYPVSTDGIYLYDCEGTVIGPQLSEPSNVIANCGRNGVSTLESPSTILAGNRIFNCGDMAIDHELNGMDYAQGGDVMLPLDPQNPPRVLHAHRIGNLVDVRGEIMSTPDKQLSLEFFGGEEDLINASGTAKYLLGRRNVTTDGAGHAAFSFTLTVSSLPEALSLLVAATATRLDRSHGTSELGYRSFSGNLNAVSAKNPEVDPAWVPSGVNSGPEYGLDPDSIDDVDVATAPGVVQAIVRPSSGRYRIAGWTNPNMLEAPDYNSAFFVRGKFYVYTSNAAAAPVNTVPNFRLRVENEGAVLASVNYSHAATGASAPPHEPLYALLNNPDLEAVAGPSLRPSSNPLKPSLYRVDLSPPPVPSVVGSRIGATFESYSTEDPANGTLSLTEVVLGTYVPALGGSDIEYVYVHSTDAATLSYLGMVEAPGIVSTGGAFNAENNFFPGRRPALDTSAEVSPTQLASVTHPAGLGTLMDTVNCPDDKFGVAILNIAQESNALKPRIEPGKSYLGIFIVASDIPAEPEIPGQETQAGLSFQMQTAGGAVSARVDLGGPTTLMAPGSVGRAIAAEALPSSQAMNASGATYPVLPGERAVAYFVFLSSPLDPDIRQDVGGALGPLGAEPGPGVDAASYRDITMGINLMQQPTTLRLSPTQEVPWAAPNRGRLRVLLTALLKRAHVDDGGYGY